MKGNLLVGILAVAAVGIVGAMALQVFLGQNIGAEAPHSSLVATIYKSPSCGCCGQYAAYLEEEGYGVQVEGVADMSAIKQAYGVPYELESCHTMEIAGYVVEGHVPDAAVQKLLADKPDIKGIGMAGMPSGSPGMPGPKTADFVIYEITHEGAKGNVFMTI